MKRYKVAFFDLDGTLTNSALGITNSLMYALDKFNIHVEDRTSLYKCIGPPLLDSFKKYYHFTQKQAEEAAVYYREYFTAKGIFENQVYDGIPEMLTELKYNGIMTAVASAKPEVFVKQILHHFNLYDCFQFTGGADRDLKRNQKNEVIGYVLEMFTKTDKKEIVMIGDRQDDILGAQKNQLDSVGVLYGFGSRSELQTAGASYLIESVNELQNKLINGF